MKDLTRICVRLALSIALGLLSACEAYDSGLIASGLALGSNCGDGIVDASEYCDPAIEAGKPGACPKDCGRSDDACAPLAIVGSGCRQRCMVVRVTEARNGDGCCPEQIGAAEDDDCGACGDGVVGPSESCDPPDSCPTPEMCDSDDPCITAVFSGKAKKCTARCELKPISECVDGDRCCPAGCGAADAPDDDCSSSCGDGIIASNGTETCEADSESDPCPTRCEDDDPCTRDLLVGSADNCNARCTHTAITTPTDEDGCCPKDAHALNDSDCRPRCGNGVTEDGEDCDFGELCSETCKLMFHPSLTHRYRFAGKGATAEDTVGGADARLVNVSLRGHDALELEGGDSGQYVDLPNGLISGLQSATIEIWIAWTGTGTSRWQRIFDFGNNAGGEGEQSGGATSFWFLTTSNRAGGVGAYINFSGAAGDVLNDRNASTAGLLRDGLLHHVAVVFNGEKHSMQLYVDGRLEQNISGLAGNLSDIDDRNSWIGRSNWGDDNLEAVIREFRIYRSALTATDVRFSYENGSDPPAEFPLNRRMR